MPPQIPGARDLQQSALSNFARSSAFVRPQTETDLKNPSSQSVVAINIHKCFFFIYICMPREAGRGNALHQTNVLTAHLVSSVFLLVRLSEEDNPVELSIGQLPGTTPDQGLENDLSRGASSLCSALLLCQQLPLRHGDLLRLAMCSGNLQLVPAVKSCFSLFSPTFQ